MGLHFVLIFLFLALNLCGSTVFSAKKKKTFNRRISVQMNLSGDLSQVDEFEGPLGSSLLGKSKNPNPLCENTTFFREALYQGQKSLEVWLTLVCTFEEQKLTYKMPRFFINLKSFQKPVLLPAQSEKLKKINLQLENLQIK